MDAFPDFNLQRGDYEVWQAIVQVKVNQHGGLSFVPVSAKMVDAAFSSIAFSPLVELMGQQNITWPSHDISFVYPQAAI